MCSPSLRVAEAISLIAMVAGAVLVYLIGARLGGRLTGIFAAALLSCSALLFRYHVFAREVFVIVAVLWASWLALQYEAVSVGRGGRRWCC